MGIAGRREQGTSAATATAVDYHHATAPMEPLHPSLAEWQAHHRIPVHEASGWENQLLIEAVQRNEPIYAHRCEKYQFQKIA